MQAFHKECPRWDLNTPNVVAELCQERGHDSCIVGQPLDSQTRHDRGYKWATVKDVIARSGDNGRLAYACGIAHEFATNCPAWDPNAADIAKKICSQVKEDCAPAFDAEGKKAAARMVRPDLEAALRRDLAIESMREPNDAKRAVSEVRGQMALYKCYDPSGAAELEGRVNTWAESTEAAIVEEIQCRASDECRARRIANQICATIADRREANGQIAAERRNPGGVVNLRTLHDLGERIQYDDATIANLKRDYAGLARKAFTETACSR